MRKSKLLVILIIILLGCQEKDALNMDAEQAPKMKYLNIKRGGYIDTTYRILTKNKLIDSVYNLTYQYINESDTISEYFSFPLYVDKGEDDSKDKFTLIGQKEIKYLEKSYAVYKYYIDLENADDLQMLYFFVPEFGVIINKSAWWGNYDRLIDNGKNEDADAIFFICEMILYDSEFYKNY